MPALLEAVAKLVCIGPLIGPNLKEMGKRDDGVNHMVYNKSPLWCISACDLSLH